ncbi:MAG: AAA family ATPase [Candidatus Pacebacteria bacterium]|nr:AAA family ATPase [Candidatus Paceibacterota bacterium]
MELIILRGLPGCGKSTIAEKLGGRLDAPVVFGDFFKREFMKSNSSFENKEMYQYSYIKIFEKIKELFENGNKRIITEELFNDKNLVDKIKEFCKENNINIKSFFIERDIEKLLEIEESRERKIKNTKVDFEKLEKEIIEIEIEDEIILNNNKKIEGSLEFILSKIV